MTCVKVLPLGLSMELLNGFINVFFVIESRTKTV